MLRFPLNSVSESLFPMLIPKNALPMWMNDLHLLVYSRFTVWGRYVMSKAGEQTYSPGYGKTNQNSIDDILLWTALSIILRVLGYIVCLIGQSTGSVVTWPEIRNVLREHQKIQSKLRRTRWKEREFPERRKAKDHPFPHLNIPHPCLPPVKHLEFSSRLSADFLTHCPTISHHLDFAILITRARLSTMLF